MTDTVLGSGNLIMSKTDRVPAPNRAGFVMAWGWGGDS